MMYSILKPFYIFWKSISFGMSGMEERAVASIVFGLFLNVWAMANVASGEFIKDKALIFSILFLFIAVYVAMSRRVQKTRVMPLMVVKTTVKKKIASAFLVISYFVLSLLFLIKSGA